MPYIQKSTPPPNKMMTFVQENFVGGLNNRAVILGFNEASDILNMQFTDQNIMEKRVGSKRYIADTLPDPIEYLDTYRPFRSAERVVRGTVNGLRIGDTVVPDFSPDVEVSKGVNFQGNYFYTNNEQLYIHGDNYPTASNTYTTIVGTAPAQFATMKVVNPPETFTALPAPHRKGVTVWNYTAKTVHYEPCQYELEDPYKGANVLPQKMKYIVTHLGRIFASGNSLDDDNVFITDVSNPFYFPVSLPLQLPPNSDSIRGLIVYNNGVVVGRKDDLYIVSGLTNNPELGLEMFSLRRLNSHTGFMNWKSVSLSHNYLFFLGGDGNVYLLSSTYEQQHVMNTSILNQQVDLFRAPINLTLEDLATACAYFHQDHWYLSVNDKVLVYSYRHRAWTLYDNLFIRAFSHIGYDLIWGDKDGDVCTWDKTRYVDKEHPYMAVWQGRYNNMDDAVTFKQFREFYIVAHTFDGYKTNIRVKFEIDQSDIKNNINIDTQTSIFGEAKFGDRFITRNINQSQPFQIGQRARSIRFSFVNGYKTHASVASYAKLNDVTPKTNEIMAYVQDEDMYYVFVGGNEWQPRTLHDLNQPMRVYQISGDYELRGKR